MKTVFHVLLGILAFATASAAPSITGLSPTRLVYSVGQSTSLSVTATGSGTLSYQWSRNGRAIVGATGSSYSLSPIAAQHGGYYLVDVTDSNGTTRSAPIFLTVAPVVTHVAAWGSNSQSQLNVPAGLTNAIAVTGGGEHAVALKRDGTVVAWGRNVEGETEVPIGLANVVGVSASGGNGNHTLALKSDGTVVSWGWNAGGQTDVPAGIVGAVAVAGGGVHSMALKSDGTVIVWGGIASVPVGLTGVIAVAAGSGHCLALKNDGTVVAWGSNDFGQTDVPAGLTSVVAIAAGQWSSLALKSNGSVVAWGYIGAPDDLSSVLQIAAGGYHSLALKSNGSVEAWGLNGLGPTTIPADLSNVFSISGGGEFSMALREAGADVAPAITVQPTTQTLPAGSLVTFTAAASGAPAPTYQWKKNGVAIAGATGVSYNIASIGAGNAGSYTFVATNYLGSATSNAATLTVNPLPVVTTVSSTRNVLIPGQSLDLSVTATGTGTLGYQWYRNGRPIAGATGAGYSLNNPMVGDTGAYWVAVSDDYGTSRKTFFVTVASNVTSLVGWGDNSEGQLNVPAGLNDLIGISINGNGTSLGLKRNGTIVTWGSDAWGVADVFPIDLADVVAVSASPFFGVALKSDGTVAAWGHNSVGQTDVPAGLTDVVSIAAGQNHTLALKSDGTVVAWGYNYSGQATVPAGLSNVIFITTQNDYSIAVKGDGTLVYWGPPPLEELIPPAGLNSISAVSLDGYHALALKNDGTVFSWGSNLRVDRTTVPAGLAGVTAVVSVGQLALKSNGTIFSWGPVNAGYAAVPANLLNVYAVVSTGSWGFALCGPDPSSVITLQPANQGVLAGGSVSFTATATGLPAPALRWQRLSAGSSTWVDLYDGGNYSGSTTTTLTVGSVVDGMNGDQFRCVATNSTNSATSTAVTLTVGIVSPSSAVVTITVE